MTQIVTKALMESTEKDSQKNGLQGLKPFEKVAFGRLFM